MLKHGNQKYNGSVPYKTGDRYYVQDNVLDFRALQDFIGNVMKDVGLSKSVSLPFVISGGVVTKGAGDTLDITAGRGYAEFEVEIPDSFASTPPSKTAHDLAAIRVEWASQNDMAIASATLDGGTTNYVKVAYAESNGNTRDRVKSSGSYNYETSPSYTITVDSDAPTDYEICLATFTGTSGGSFTINNNVKNLLKNSPAIDEYDASTTYAQDDEVMYLGQQYTSMKDSNTGNDPLFDLDYWYPTDSKENLLKYFRNGLVQRGGVEDIHNYRDAGYRQWFPMGKLFFSSNNGEGKVFQAYGVHMDGTTVTGDTDLEDILDESGSAEYPFIDLFAPDSAGTRTLLDYRGRVPRAVDGTGGNTKDVSEVQEDAMQRITGKFQNTVHAGSSTQLIGNQSGVFSSSTAFTLPYANTSGSVTEKIRTEFDNADSTSPNTAKTDDSETRMKNWTEGVPYIVVLKEI